ncbi:hypothetical protein GCM10017786_51770 [Amycolatopsis deserti]|uniref:Mycothiol-dependent maleylpyruvate isomerase metal-binding domain-containing protein n=1 Tax=Amycolatopsis deserti TaxID=185696 RepID=A0ABQ3JCW9_9PSEU|nr:maleylpyruvate isomerase family mycothiol-dependent enzyme [Amycolatopsis deserti]GHF11612.1 hypothetical protein GCM10017786_51770 [Amycolatopsis deserti]
MEIFGPVLDVRPLFGRERHELLTLLESLSAQEWSAPTVCPGWTVHDIAGHILNDYMRRLSGSRDGFAGAKFANDETLPAYLARVNDEFVRAMRQCSPQLIVQLLTVLGPELDRLWATFDLTAPAALDVSWAGDGPSPAWLDIAREYTEFWVHQQQIRDAVGRPGADQLELAGPVLDAFMRALPHTLRDVVRPEGTAVRVTLDGAGTWHARSDGHRWRMAAEGEPAATVTMRPGDFWRLATRGISPDEARRRATTTGDPELAEAVTSLVAVVA